MLVSLQLNSENAIYMCLSRNGFEIHSLKNLFPKCFFFRQILDILAIISNINYRCFTFSCEIYKCFSSATLYLANEIVHIFLRKQIRVTNLRFFFNKQVGSRKNRLRSIVVCVTHMQTGYESKAWPGVISAKNNIYILLFYIWMSL